MKPSLKCKLIVQAKCLQASRMVVHSHPKLKSEENITISQKNFGLSRRYSDSISINHVTSMDDCLEKIIFNADAAFNPSNMI